MAVTKNKLVSKIVTPKNHIKMAFKGIKRKKPGKNGLTQREIRKKLGVTQHEFAGIFDLSRSTVALVESGRRNFNSVPGTLLTNMYLHFHELETGKKTASRSPETKLFLNAEYKKMLPVMKSLEQDCRNKIKQLKLEMEEMKEKARDSEHTIIVLTKVILDAQEQEKPGNKNDRQVERFHFLKQQAYERLLTCWEPEQAKLDAKIEAIAGEAKALRRYRVKVMREHDPFKKKKGDK